MIIDLSDFSSSAHEENKIYTASDGVSQRSKLWIPGYFPARVYNLVLVGVCVCVSVCNGYVFVVCLSLSQQC